MCVYVFLFLSKYRKLEYQTEIRKDKSDNHGLFSSMLICNLSSLFQRLVLKGIKVGYPNMFMQMVDPFQLQMRVLYSFVGNIRSVIEINQKSEFLGNITVKGCSPIMTWKAGAIASKIHIHIITGLPNIGECCPVRYNKILPLIYCSGHASISNSSLSKSSYAT